MLTGSRNPMAMTKTIFSLVNTSFVYKYVTVNVWSVHP